MAAKLALRNENDPDDVDLGQFDLNLLVVLNALLKHRNITHAGNALHLSQPATSRALTRLRELFDDNLLVRNQRSFDLTPLAKVLMPKIDAALGNIDRVFANRIFAPERFSVAMPDHIAFFLAPMLTAYFREISATTIFLPHIRLSNILNQMSDGGVDLALGLAEDTPPGFYCRALPPIPSLCLVAKGHVALKSAVSYADLGRFLSLRIGTVYNKGFGEVYDGLEALRPRGRETMTVPDIHTAARLVHDTDAVLVLPSPSARFLARSFGLETFLPKKGPLPPSYQMSLIWHERWHRNSIHAAVRSMIASQVMDGKANAANDR